MYGSSNILKKSRNICSKRALDDKFYTHVERELKMVVDLTISAFLA